MKKKIGLVLSGGGIRGMAHIGMLKALEEHGVQPDYLSGASAGALVAGLYSAGHAPEVILDFFRETPIFNFSFYSMSKPGLFDIEKYSVFYEKYFPENDFAYLKRTLFIVATDLVNAESKYFTEGKVIQPLLASAALPPVFTPVEIDGELYSDGGIMNNFPIDPLLPICDVILGCNVSTVTKANKEDLNSSFQIFWRSTELTYLAVVKPKLEMCDFLIQPAKLMEFNILDARHIDDAFQIGYVETKKAIEKMMGTSNNGLFMPSIFPAERQLLLQ